MLCITRYTNEKYAQRFADGHHKFYLEFRCNAECEEGENVCEKCSNITNGPVVQYFRTYNHGKVNEPIPDRSHIYGGKWYHGAVLKYGAPPSEIIEFAIQSQRTARAGFIVKDYDPDELDKTKKESVVQEMPRAKQTKTDEKPNETPNETPDKKLEVTPIKRQRKPKVASLEPTTTVVKEPVKEPVKRTRKPKIAAETVTEDKPVKKPISRKKPVAMVTTTNLLTTPTALVTKEVVIPTHIEKNLEKIDAHGFEIEYIKLSVFEANGSTYLIDSNKNKLYKKVKDRVGSYVGRWNPNTDSIITDIPDSDDEN